MLFYFSPYRQANSAQDLPNWTNVQRKSPIEPDNTYVAWHIPSKAFFNQDGVSTTVDVDEAGRFSIEGIKELEHKHPGPPFSIISPHRLSEIYDANGAPRIDEPYRLRYDEYVVYGIGPKAGLYSYVKPASEQGLSGTTEYERRQSWAWKLFSEDSWHLASSPEEADEQARQAALKIMQNREDHSCSYFLAIKHRREVTNALEVHR